MRKLLASILILSIGLLWGCGGDDNGTDGGGGTPPVRLQVNTSVAAPTMSSPDETVWNSVDSVMVGVSAANTPKVVPGAKIASVPSEVKVQAIALNDTLYVRLRWADPTFSAYPHLDTVTTTSPLTFSRDVTAQEDQAFVMFESAVDTFDVWGWQVLRTGGLGLGMGYTYADLTLTPDAEGTASLETAVPNNEQNFTTPIYMSGDTSEFNGYILYLPPSGNTVRLDDTLRVDTIDVGGQQVFNVIRYDQSTGWTIGQKLPGYVLDSSVVAAWRSDANRGSILDIRTTDNYSGGMYSLVMKRAMNTGYEDDLNMIPLDSVKVVIGLFDNQDSFTTGGTKRGFSIPFWVIF